jgi:HSP20 family protein
MTVRLLGCVVASEAELGNVREAQSMEVYGMTIVRRPSPFGELMSLRRAVDRLFDEDFYRAAPDGSGSDQLLLPLDVTTTRDALVVEAALPGVRPEAVEITVENGTLTITGQTAEERTEEGTSHLVREIRRGLFSRSVTLPNGLEPDKAEATFEHGVLRLRIPKAEQVKPRQIRITPVTDGGTSSGGPAIKGSGAGA